MSECRVVARPSTPPQIHRKQHRFFAPSTKEPTVLPIRYSLADSVLLQMRKIPRASYRTPLIRHSLPGAQCCIPFMPKNTGLPTNNFFLSAVDQIPALMNRTRARKNTFRGSIDNEPDCTLHSEFGYQRIAAFWSSRLNVNLAIVWKMLNAFRVPAV